MISVRRRLFQDVLPICLKPQHKNNERRLGDASTMAQPLWKKTRFLLFVEPMLQLQFRRGNLTAQGMTNPKAVEAHGSSRFCTHVRKLCKKSRFNEAPYILNDMDRRGIQAESSTYGFLLQECADNKALQAGKVLHALMICSGFRANVFLETKLVIMYAKCESLGHARLVLDQMPKRNVVVWTAMIAAYARHGRHAEALMLFYDMERAGVQANQFTFSSVLPACAKPVHLEHGRKLHGEIIRKGFQSDVFVERALVDVYTKCGEIEDARQLFDKMSEPNLVSWTAVISGYARNGYVGEALKLFQNMTDRDAVAWNVMIAGCAQNGYADEAQKFFQKMRDGRDVVSWNAMIAGFAQNGHVHEARKLFWQMPEQDLISWNGMIAGYARNGYVEEALELFRHMQLTGMKPDSITFTSVLACAGVAALEHGKKIHVDIIRWGFQFDTSVANALIDVYAKSEAIDHARQVFDKMPERNVVSWTAMIAGCAQNGHVEEALHLFQRMPERNVVSWNAMIAGYTQNDHVGKALNMFQKMPDRDVVLWTAMIGGYEQAGHFDEALKLFQEMQSVGVTPVSVTFSSVLPACANLPSFICGREVHEKVIRTGYLSDICVASALVDMYAKCGSLQDACRVFDKMPKRNVVSWNAMILGYAMHGCCRDAHQIFEQMQQSETKPNQVTFIGVLSACCYAGLVDDGQKYFDCMTRDYQITPVVEHYCCMVDLFARAGCIAKAQDFINEMPIKATAAMWGSLLAACRFHGNIEVGECVAQQLLGLEPENAACYVLLSNIYAAAGRWDDVENVRNLMKDRGIQKRPGCSWLEVKNKVYSFVVGDRSHPQMYEIYAELERLSGPMKQAGYAPNTDSALNNVEEDLKEHILFHNNEKTAITFGPLHTFHETPLWIVKEHLSMW